MKSIIKRYSENPILTPGNLQLSDSSIEIMCLLNPGVFVYKDRIGLLLRVAVRPLPKPGFVSILTAGDRGFHIMDIATDDKNLDLSDPRVLTYKGDNYLTTLSYLQPMFSDDGINFYEDADYPGIYGKDDYSTFGIEDCRVTFLEGKYYLTFTSVSSMGVCVAMKMKKDWVHFTDMGLILPPHNKDCTLFDEKIEGRYFLLHRPSSPEIGGNYIWLAESEDLLHWGNHQCVATTRPGMWDSARIGAGAAPIKTEKGWLVIYHGADHRNRYCLGGLLLSLNEPSKVLARSKDPLMVPEADYEKVGFFGDVIFTNGHVVDGDTITIYYGASDEVICKATASIQAILDSLELY